jgi:hypothetical protein
VAEAIEHYTQTRCFNQLNTGCTKPDWHTGCFLHRQGSANLPELHTVESRCNSNKCYNFRYYIIILISYHVFKHSVAFIMSSFRPLRAGVISFFTLLNTRLHSINICYGFAHLRSWHCGLGTGLAHPQGYLLYLVALLHLSSFFSFIVLV